jgi:hypothetical protein
MGHYRALTKKDIGALYASEWETICNAIDPLPNESASERDTRVTALLSEKIPMLGTVTLALIYVSRYYDICLWELQERLRNGHKHPMALSTLMFIYGIPSVEAWLGEESMCVLEGRIAQTAKDLGVELIEEYFFIYKDIYLSAYIFYEIAGVHPEKEHLLAFLNKNS